MKCKGTHFSLTDRQIIEKGIFNGSKKAAIAETLGKDNSTIGKEIKLHRILKHKCNLPLECSSYKSCEHHHNCSTSCNGFSQFHCKRRDRSPGACNGCNDYKYCRFDKYYYDAFSAHDSYRISLIDSREGVNISTQDAITLGNFIKPLIAQGQSPYDIVTNHPELGICEKTLYNYISSGVFQCVGILDIDLRIKPSRKMSKDKKTAFKKRQDRKYLLGRSYHDYKNYLEGHPTASVVQMDTVYNDISDGPFIQTFKFIDYGFLLCIYHDLKTAEEMCNGVDLLDRILGRELFQQCVEVLLTDRGTEFCFASQMENRKDKSRRTRVFYCDPMQSGQKGSLENNHRELRYICPNKVDLHELGLVDQTSLNLVVSHINSFPKDFLKGKTPIEMTRFLNPELLEKLLAFGIEEIEKDKVILKPYLLKKKQ